MLWLLTLLIVFLVLSLFFGGFHKGSKVGGSGPARPGRDPRGTGPGRPGAGLASAVPADQDTGAAHETGADPLSLLAALLALTVVSGLVDAVSYLGLGHVFTANMTGNVVVLGFAAAGAPGFSITATLTSLGVFLAGAVLGGRVASRVPGRERLLTATMMGEAVAIGAASLVAFLAGTAPGWPRFTVIAILAIAMGMRNAAVRRIGIRDLTTTVLTQTLTGLAADSRLAGGTDPRAVRRAGAVVAMLAGAACGAVLFLHVGARAAAAGRRRGEHGHRGGVLGRRGTRRPGGARIGVMSDVPTRHHTTPSPTTSRRPGWS